MTARAQATRQRRCTAEVEKRDEYRLHRGRGFRMSYVNQQCSRPAKDGDLCWQHLRHPPVFRRKYPALYMDGLPDGADSRAVGD